MNRSDLDNEALKSVNEKPTRSDVEVCSYDQGGLDGSLAHILADGIGLSVTVAGACDGGHPLVIQATADPNRVHTETAPDSATVRQALALPAGGVAVWSSPTGQAQRIARHAMSLLELAISRNESKQLLAEVDALTNHVMQDFEELSLIRTLASSLELPQVADNTNDFVIAALMPLATGVGAVSIAAVLADDSGSGKRRPLWTGPQVVGDETVISLISDMEQKTISVLV